MTNDTQLQEYREAEAVAARVEASVSLAGEIQREAGVLALGRMTDAAFGDRLAMLKRGLERLDQIVDEVLVPGIDNDYAVLPGTKKLSLLQPGAEKLCFIARLVPSFQLERIVGDGAATPAVHYTVRCDLHLGSADGPVIAQGVGTCNTHETRYRYLTGERSCPECGCVGTIRKSKFTDKATGDLGWYCHAKAGGCGAQFASTDDRIAGQESKRIENPDPMNLDNTCAKMAKKRALVDATKTATGGSARLTQDAEEGAQPEPDAKAAKPSRKDAHDALMLAAKDAGLHKIGEVLAAVVDACGVRKVLSTLNDVTTEQMIRTAESLRARRVEATE